MRVEKYNEFYTFVTISTAIILYFMLSCRISRNIGENIFRSYTGTTSENTDFHVLVLVNTIGNIFTRGFATRGNITDSVHSVK